MRYVSDFIDAVRARREVVAQGIARGTAPDYAAYQRLVGQISGLDEALDILNNLLKDDEDDR
jgi:hypothetical protein